MQKVVLTILKARMYLYRLVTALNSCGQTHTFMMEVSQYYAASLGGALLIFSVFHGLDSFGHKIYDCLAYGISKCMVYPLVIQRRYWASITVAHAIFLLAYAITNGVCMGIAVKNSKDLMVRSGMMAMINLVPLFLGGRTSALADRLLGIPLHTYYIAHHWIGRVAVIQGVLHAILALTSNNAVDMRAISGIIVGKI